MGEHHFGNFTLGIIDLLMNNTGEFVTERSHPEYRKCVKISSWSFPREQKIAFDRTTGRSANL